jgi:hypothetical protein
MIFITNNSTYKQTNLSMIKDECLGKSGYLISLDARKAYDSVSHKFIGETLLHYGFDRKFVDIFKVLYNDISTKVIVNGFLSKSIKIGRGVKQGDALSCSLFILLMDVVIKGINQRCVSKVTMNNHPLKNTIAYADDVGYLGNFL